MSKYLVIIGWLLSFSVAAEVKDIDNNALQKLLKDKVTIVDIRTPEEWKETGIVEGSHLLTFFDKNGRYNIDAWMSDFEKIVNKNQPVILICRTGNRTTTVSNFLDKKMGYQSVYNVKKGILDWIKTGNPIVKVP